MKFIKQEETKPFNDAENLPNNTERKFYYVNPQERKPQAQCDWQDLLQGRAHNVHKVDVCALSLLCKSPRAQAAGAARLVGFTARTGAQCPQSGRLCVEFAIRVGDG